MMILENTWICGYDNSWTRTINNTEITISFKQVITFLDQHHIEIVNLTTEQLEPLLIKTNREADRIQQAYLSYPIIVIKNKGKITQILDGQHRVLKAITNNIKTVPARILDLTIASEIFQRVFN